MDIETVKAKMREQVDDVRKIAPAYGWLIQEDNLFMYVEMRHRRKPEHVYLVRVVFDDYPMRAPSYVFVSRDSKSPGSWPPGVKHGADPPGICTPGTRECIEVYHKNDSQYQWDPKKYPTRMVLMEIQKLLEKGIGE